MLGVTVTKQVIEKPFQVIQSILNVLGLEVIKNRVSIKNKDILVFNPINHSYGRADTYNLGRKDVDQINLNKSTRTYVFYSDSISYQRMTDIVKAKQVKEIEEVVLPF